MGPEWVSRERWAGSPHLHLTRSARGCPPSDMRTNTPPPPTSTASRRPGPMTAAAHCADGPFCHGHHQTQEALSSRGGDLDQGYHASTCSEDTEADQMPCGQSRGTGSKTVVNPQDPVAADTGTQRWELAFFPARRKCFQGLVTCGMGTRTHRSTQPSGETLGNQGQRSRKSKPHVAQRRNQTLERAER